MKRCGVGNRFACRLQITCVEQAADVGLGSRIYLFVQFVSNLNNLL